VTDNRHSARTCHSATKSTLRRATKSTLRRVSRIATCLLAGAITTGALAVGTLGLAAGPAGASTVSSGGASGYPFVWCDPVHHSLSVQFEAQPQIIADMNGILVTQTASPMWIEVYAYVTSSNTWGSPGAHTMTLMNQPTTYTALSRSFTGVAGRYYQFGFNVRYGVPGSTWSNWV